MLFRDILLHARFAFIQADLSPSGSHIAVVGIRHFAGTVDNAPHDADLHAHQMGSSGFDTRNRFFQIVQRPSATRTGDIFRFRSTYTPCLQDSESRSVNHRMAQLSLIKQKDTVAQAVEDESAISAAAFIWRSSAQFSA